MFTAIFDGNIFHDLHTVSSGSAIKITGNEMVLIKRSSFRSCSSSSNGGVIFLTISNKYDINISCFSQCYSSSYGSTFHATSIDTAVNSIYQNSMSFCSPENIGAIDTIYPVYGSININLVNNSYAQLGTSSTFVLRTSRSRESTMCTAAHAVSDVAFAPLANRNDFDFVIYRYNVVNLSKGSNRLGLFSNENSIRTTVDSCIIMYCNAICLAEGHSGGTIPMLMNCFVHGNIFVNPPQSLQEDDSTNTFKINHLKEWRCIGVPTLSSSLFSTSKLFCLNIFFNLFLPHCFV